MLQKLVTGLVDFGGGWVSFKVSGASDLAWEVVASVEEFEEASNGIEVFIDEVNSAFLISC